MERFFKISLLIKGIDGALEVVGHSARCEPAQIRQVDPVRPAPVEAVRPKPVEQELQRRNPSRSVARCGLSGVSTILPATMLPRLDNRRE